MGRSVFRVVVAVGVFAAGGLAWIGLVAAAGPDINVTADPAKCDKQWGPPCFTPSNGTVTPAAVGETVTWHVLDGTHTVTPVDAAAFGGSGDLTGPDGTFSVTFDRPGVFAFYCKHHGSVEDDGKTHHGMWGKIDVKGEATTTTAKPPPPADPPPDPPKEEPGKPEPRPAPPPAPSPPPTPPPTSSHGSSPPPSGGSNGSGPNGETARDTGRPYVGPPPSAPPPSPPPTRAAAAPSEPSAPQPPARPRDDDRDEPAFDPDATAVPPDEAVLPPSPTFSSPTTAPMADEPEGTPHGDTIAILKSEPGGGHRRRLILFGTIFGVGAFVAGVGGWKYFHRASKYWPA